MEYRIGKNQGQGEKGRNFEQVIDKAIMACRTAGHPVADHFADVSKTISRPKLNKLSGIKNLFSF
jgi:hypothetical protein